MDALTMVIWYVGPALYAGVLAYTFFSDLVRFCIPNVASIVLVAAFFPVALTAPAWAFSWSEHFLAFLAVFVVGLGVWRLGWMGAGDVKLLSAVSLWVGLPNLLTYLAFVGLAGGGAVVIIFVARRLAVTVGAFSAAVRTAALPRVLVTGEQIPYGVAISGVGLYYLWKVPPFTHLVFLHGPGI